MSKIMLPAGRPLKEGLAKYLSTFDMSAYKVALVGVRGYFKNTLGNPDKNDVGIYDDAIFIVTPDGVEGYNANTDPSVLKPHVAVLKVGGPYLYRIGMHNMKAPYEALRQFGNVTVLRDGKENTDCPANRFYIDIHKGGYGTTSSLGCQTIHPTQWMNFLNSVKAALKKYQQVTVPYFLADNG